MFAMSAIIQTEVEDHDADEVESDDDLELFSITLDRDSVFIMDENENITKAISGCLHYKGKYLNFIEKDGLYAYSEFFMEGEWPQKYFDDEYMYNELYDGIWLKMISGGWDASFSDLIQAIRHPIGDISEEDESEMIVVTMAYLKGKQ